MSVLWKHLTQCNENPTPQPNMLQVAAQLGSRNAIICSVNAATDAFSLRNANLMRERFVSFGFKRIIDVRNAVCSENGTVDVMTSLRPAIAELASITSSRDFAVVYVTCSSPLDVTMIAKELNSPDHDLIPRACLIVDAAATAPFAIHALGVSSTRAAEFTLPVLTPKESFTGHITLKMLHASLDLGDSSSSVTLDGLAARISDIADLHNEGSTAVSSEWNTLALVSRQKGSFIACISQEVPTDEVPEGRSVGQILKRIIPQSKIRLVLSSDQGFVMSFSDEETGEVPTADVDSISVAFENSCADANTVAPTITAVLPSEDRRIHAEISRDAFRSFQCALESDEVQLVVPDSEGVTRQFKLDYIGVTFKFEVVTTYREFLLFEALARLHTPSAGDTNAPARSTIRVEDVGTISVQPLDASSKNQQQPPAVAPAVEPAVKQQQPEPESRPAEQAPQSQPSQDSTDLRALIDAHVERAVFRFEQEERRRSEALLEQTKQDLEKKFELALKMERERHARELQEVSESLGKEIVRERQERQKAIELNTLQVNDVRNRAADKATVEKALAELSTSSHDALVTSCLAACQQEIAPLASGIERLAEELQQLARATVSSEQNISNLNALHVLTEQRVAALTSSHEHAGSVAQLAASLHDRVLVVETGLEKIAASMNSSNELDTLNARVKGVEQHIVLLERSHNRDGLRGDLQSYVDESVTQAASKILQHQASKFVAVEDNLAVLKRYIDERPTPHRAEDSQPKAPAVSGSIELTAAASGRIDAVADDLEMTKNTVTRNMKDVKDLRSRVEKLELVQADVTGLLEHEHERATTLHDMEEKMERLETQVEVLSHQ